jgi:hypothetical protein
MLGENPAQISYLIGFSDNFIMRAHHKGSSCKSIPEECLPEMEFMDADNPNHVIGALVRGINGDDTFNPSRQNKFNRIRLFDNFAMPGVFARIFKLFGKVSNINPELFPKPLTLGMGPEEYPKRYTDNYKEYKLYLQGILDSPFDSLLTSGNRLI